MRILQAAVVALLTAMPMTAPAVTAMGHGTVSCGTWLANKTPAQRAWVLGYLSGAAAFSDQDVLAPASIDPEGLFAWIDSYCRGHPLDTLTDATNRLFFELIRRRSTDRR